MIKNKIVLALSLVACSSFATNTYVIRVPTELKMGSWNNEIEYSDWRHHSEPYGCSEWSPEPDSIELGVKFQQEQTCLYDAERTAYHYKTNTVTGDKLLEKEEFIIDTLNITEQREQTGSKTTRNMCIDILNRGDSTGNGEYLVDPDGGGNLPERIAYCDMTGGGWTLYDGFGKKLLETKAETPSAYNHNSINSTITLTEAGYKYYLTTINTSQYVRSDYYMQFFYSSDPKGYIEKTLPAWVQAVKVSASNDWYKNPSYTSLGNETISMPSYASHRNMVFSGSGKLRLLETGIYWIDSVWVK